MIKRKVVIRAAALLCAYLMVFALFATSACTPACEHEFNNGVCTICGKECTHEFTDTGECKICGELCAHDFEDGKCLICGAEQKQHADYSYVPHVDSTLPRIDITDATASKDFEKDATRQVSEFDNNNPQNNIDWQYRSCTVSVSNCDEKYGLSDIPAGVKVRGNWTTTYPKKPFRIKFDKKQGMLGLNKENKFKSWVLLADYKDVSLERNSLAFYLGKAVLGSDGYYTSDCRQVELYINGKYWGVYLLAEQQQVNSNRIDVAEPEDGYLGTDIGYFLEYDGYYNLEVYNERFSLDYGSIGWLKGRDGQYRGAGTKGFSIKNDVYEDESKPEYVNGSWNPQRYPQKTFIKNYMYNVYKLCYNAVYNNVYYKFNDDYTALVSYTPKTENKAYETVSQVVDIQSLVDTYIHCEIACDSDLGWSSFFMSVDFGADGDRILRFEAPWDFDSAYGLKDACQSAEGLYAANSSNPWLTVLINENWFWNRVKDKWFDMTRAKVQESALKYINTLKTTFSLKEYKRNFDKWGFVKSGECNWEVQWNVNNHSQASDQLYNWVNKRFNYLNSLWL